MRGNIIISIIVLGVVVAAVAVIIIIVIIIIITNLRWGGWRELNVGRSFYITGIRTIRVRRGHAVADWNIYFKIRRGNPRARKRANGILHPEGEMRQCIQAVRPLIIIQETATVAPAAALVFYRLGRFPFPGPIELNRRTAFSRVIAHELNVGIILQVGICMELSCDQVVQLL